MDEQAMARYYEQINAQQQANNAWSAEQAQKAMDYQTEMSNTAHQREVADLKAAGLNPVLSAGGSGATTGSGFAASAGNENVTALYGLAKMALESSIEQAKAQSTTSRAAAGGSFGGKKSPDSRSSVFDILSKSGSELSDNEYYELASLIVDSIGDAEAGFLSRYTHMSRKKAKALVDAFAPERLPWIVSKNMGNAALKAMNSRGKIGNAILSGLEPFRKRKQKF